jgi:transposase
MPLAASTQWERVECLSSSASPVFEYMKKLASNGKRFFIDDTGNKILDLNKEIKKLNSERKGIYTTGIISEVANKTINLFFTGNRHAGENFQSLLDTRSTIDPVIMMSDALAANRPTGQPAKKF